MTNKDGVAAYRQNDRSVEGLTKEQLGDILEQFPRSSDAYTRASLQLDHILEQENQSFSKRNVEGEQQ